MQIDFIGDGEYFETEKIWIDTTNEHCVYPQGHNVIWIRPTPKLIELLKFLETLKKNISQS